jgi:uncharacterized membrane protein
MCRGLFYGQWLFIVLLLVELLTITVQTFFSQKYLKIAKSNVEWYFLPGEKHRPVVSH